MGVTRKLSVGTGGIEDLSRAAPQSSFPEQCQQKVSLTKRVQKPVLSRFISDSVRMGEKPRVELEEKGGREWRADTII